MMRRLPGRACAAALVLACLSASQAQAAADLKWDLTYESALRAHPIAENEFMRFWPVRYLQRPIHARLAAYSGEPIEASLLIEGPDGDAGDPVAQWFVKTRSAARVCTLYKQSRDGCERLDPARTEAFIREAMAFGPLRVTPSDKRTIGAAGGKPVLANYTQFLSIYIGGRVLQRPLAALEMDAAGLASSDMRHPEAGRLSNALVRLMRGDEEAGKRQAQAAGHLHETEFAEAIRAGDAARVRALAGADASLLDVPYFASSALALAVEAGNKAMVDLLLALGAQIDATEGAALKAAVRARNVAMVEYLLAKGARADPPPDAGGMVAERPLALAAGQGDLRMAQLLIRHGAEVNAGQTRPALAIAAQALDLPMMDLLLASGALPDAAGSGAEEGKTALVLLLLTHGLSPGAQPGNVARVEQVVRRLVAAGADVNRVDALCRTPWQVAEEVGSKPLMGLLTALGADPQAGARCLALRDRIRRANALP
jgi:ankyrin repeat protein